MNKKTLIGVGIVVVAAIVVVLTLSSRNQPQTATDNSTSTPITVFTVDQYNEKYAPKIVQPTDVQADQPIEIKWLTLADTQQGMTFQYPSHSKYFSPYPGETSWPPRITVEVGAFSCAPHSYVIDEGSVEERNIEGRRYCINKKVDMGWREFKYVTTLNSKVTTIKFEVVFGSCRGVVGQIERAECEKAGGTQELEVDKMVESIVQSIKFTK